MEGFLLGKAKEYGLMVDREDFDLRMDLDEELWQAQIRNAEETEAQALRMQDQMSQAKTDLSSLMRP